MSKKEENIKEILNQKDIIINNMNDKLLNQENLSIKECNNKNRKKVLFISIININ